MDFDFSPKVKDLQKRVQQFMDEHVYPNEDTYHHQVDTQGDRWQIPPIMEDMKALISATPDTPIIADIRCPRPRSRCQDRG